MKAENRCLALSGKIAAPPARSPAARVEQTSKSFEPAVEPLLRTAESVSQEPGLNQRAACERRRPTSHATARSATRYRQAAECGQSKTGRPQERRTVTFGERRRSFKETVRPCRRRCNLGHEAAGAVDRRDAGQSLCRCNGERRPALAIRPVASGQRVAAFAMARLVMWPCVRLAPHHDVVAACRRGVFRADEKDGRGADERDAHQQPTPSRCLPADEHGDLNDKITEEKAKRPKLNPRNRFIFRNAWGLC